MNWQQLPATTQWISLFSGVFAVLIAASALAAIIQRRATSPSGQSLALNLAERTRAWWVMVIGLGAAIWLGPTAVILLFAFISLQCLREFLSLTYTRRADHRAMLACFFGFLPLQYVLVYHQWYGLFSVLIPVYGFLWLPISAAMGQDPNRFLERTAKMQWGLMICVYCLSHIPALLMLPIPGYDDRNLFLIAYLILVVQASDVFQYVWGKLLGKTKIAPSISPSKTLEGLIGGWLCATALGAALYWITPFTLWQSALIALLLNVLGFFGGFVLSAIKRDRGVKDWGNMIEGHGGMLDRVDSLSFSAPVFFHVLRYFFTP